MADDVYSWCHGDLPTAVDAASVLITHNLQIAAQEYVRLLHIPSASVALVNAVTWLNMGQAHKAKDFFLVAANGTGMNEHPLFIVY